MTTHDTSDTLDRRTLLRRSLIGGAGALTACGGVGVAVAASEGDPTPGRPGRSLTVDVACLLDTTLAIIPAEVAGEFDPFTNARGSTFYVEGDLYPEGTIPDDATTDDPFDVTATERTGDWLR